MREIKKPKRGERIRKIAMRFKRAARATSREKSRRPGLDLAGPPV